MGDHRRFDLHPTHLEADEHPMLVLPPRAGPLRRHPTSEPVALFKPRVQPVTELIEQYAVNQDGTRFLVLELPPAAKGPVVQVISNWEAALDRSSRRGK